MTETVIIEEEVHFNDDVNCVVDFKLLLLLLLLLLVGFKFNKQEGL